MYAVIFTYSFDDEVSVYLFDDYDDAVKYLRESILEEYRIDTEENGWDSLYSISEDGRSGFILNQFPDRTDKTSVFLGTVYSNE